MNKPSVDLIENPQSAYHHERVLHTQSIDEDIFNAMRTYLTDDLGIDIHSANARSQKELAREIPKSILGSLSEAGIEVSGKRVLDLGAGLGGLSEELVLRGAEVTALEPGGAWAALTRRRAERHQGKFLMCNGFGEKIPLPDASFDIIISLRVLEHVKDPNQVLTEAWRVLRPGGHFLLQCENYLAFWEPHYRLPWIPLLPKWLGHIYLSALGRSPAFLKEAITYTTFHSVVRKCRSLGFLRERDKIIATNLASKQGLTWQIIRLLAVLSGGYAPRILDDARNLFKVGIHELLEKPSTTSSEYPLSNLKPHER